MPVVNIWYQSSAVGRMPAARLLAVPAETLVLGEFHLARVLPVSKHAGLARQSTDGGLGELPVFPGDIHLEAAPRPEALDPAGLP